MPSQQRVRRTKIKRNRTLVHSMDSRKHTAASSCTSKQYRYEDEHEMMHFYRLLCLAIRRTWNSHRFETLTFKLWAYFLLLTGIVAPFGQHRWFLKRVFDEWWPGWVLFPVCAAIALFSFYQFGNKWAIFPYWIFWIIDALFIPSLTLRGEK